MLTPSEFLELKSLLALGWEKTINYEALGVACDWLYEHEEPEMRECLCWLIDNKKRPINTHGFYFKVDSGDLYFNLPKSFNIDFFPQKCGSHSLHGVYCNSFEELILAVLCAYKANRDTIVSSL